MRMEDTQGMHKLLKIYDIIAFDVESLKNLVHQEVATPVLGLEEPQNKFVLMYEAILWNGSDFILET